MKLFNFQQYLKRVFINVPGCTRASEKQRLAVFDEREKIELKWFRVDVTLDVFITCHGLFVLQRGVSQDRHTSTRTYVNISELYTATVWRRFNGTESATLLREYKVRLFETKNMWAILVLHSCSFASCFDK